MLAQRIHALTALRAVGNELFNSDTAMISIEVKKKKHSISLDCQTFVTIAMASEYESGHMSLDMPSYCKQDFSRVVGSEFYRL